MPEDNESWLLDVLAQKIEKINWARARSDVEVFVLPDEVPSLQLSSKDFFKHYLEKMVTYL